MRSPDAIREAIENFAPKIKNDKSLRMAFQRGYQAITALQNGRRGKGVDLEIDVGGKLIILNSPDNSEKTPMSYSQMMHVIKRVMEAEGHIHSIKVTERDIDAMTAQAIGVSWGLLHQEENMGSGANFLAELFLRDAICK
jgi:hypothetical protein